MLRSDDALPAFDRAPAARAPRAADRRAVPAGRSEDWSRFANLLRAAGPDSWICRRVASKLRAPRDVRVN